MNVSMFKFGADLLRRPPRFLSHVQSDTWTERAHHVCFLLSFHVMSVRPKIEAVLVTESQLVPCTGQPSGLFAHLSHFVDAY